MNDVEHMRECVLWLLSYQGKLLEETILRDGMWLSNDEVVSVGEAVKGMLQEIL